MRNIMVLLAALLLYVSCASAQDGKAPPVTVDDRINNLEARVLALEKATNPVGKGAAPLVTDVIEPTTQAADTAVCPDCGDSCPKCQTTPQTVGIPVPYIDTSMFEWKSLPGVGMGWVQKGIERNAVTTATVTPTVFSAPVYSQPQAIMQSAPRGVFSPGFFTGSCVSGNCSPMQRR